MKYARVISQQCAISLSLYLLSALALGQTPHAKSRTEERRPDAPVRAFPRLDLANGQRLKYVGTIGADGSYKVLSKVGRFFAANALATPIENTPTPATATCEPARESETTHDSEAVRPTDIPDNIRIRSNEHVVADIEAPRHAVEVVKEQSVLADVRDTIVGLAYGPEVVLRAPSRITTDSRQRVLITDPVAQAVHVIDREGKSSFRIVGGPGRRLQSPNGVAVDAEDNIYVADGKRGMVLVYAPDGKFLRYLGDFKGESFYQCPTGIALDRKAGHLYLLDGPRHFLYVLDLQGAVLNRVGKHGGGKGPGEFTNPVDIALGSQELAVLDAGGTRAQILDLQGNFLREFNPLAASSPSDSKAGGLAIGGDGNIYVSDATDSTVRVFGTHGKLLSSFGAKGKRVGEFNAPTGVWVDSSNRILVADPKNLRVEIFQLGGTP